MKTLFTLLIIITLASCKTTQATEYKITDTNKTNHYVNSYTVSGNYIKFCETNRRGEAFRCDSVSVIGTKIIAKN